MMTMMMAMMMSGLTVCLCDRDPPVVIIVMMLTMMMLTMMMLTMMMLTAMMLTMLNILCGTSLCDTGPPVVHITSYDICPPLSVTEA